MAGDDYDIGMKRAYSWIIFINRSDQEHSGDCRGIGVDIITKVTSLGP